MAERSVSATKDDISSNTSSTSLGLPNSPPPQDAPGIGASGIRSRSGGMSFTVDSSISTRRFHASGNEEVEETEASTKYEKQAPTPVADKNDEERSIDRQSLDSANALRQKTELTKEQLWAHVFHNVNRAVDELYYLCEAEDCPDHTEEAVKLMIKNSRDFEKLIERFQAQKQYEASKNNSSSSVPPGVAWEVRKTANATPPLCAVFDKEAKQASMGDHVIRHALETMEEKARLERAVSESNKASPTTRAARSTTPVISAENSSKTAKQASGCIKDKIKAPPPSPSPTSSSLSAMMGNRSNMSSPASLDSSIEKGIEAPRLSARERRNRRRAENAMPTSHSPVRPIVSLDPPTLMSQPSQLSPRIPIISHKMNPPSTQSKDESVSEEILETEKVWAVAEAWVEAEAAAEELAWERLQSGDVSLSRLEADEKVREAQSMARGSPAEWLLGGDGEDKANQAIKELEEDGEEEIIDFEVVEDEDEEIMEFGSEDEEVPKEAQRGEEEEPPVSPSNTTSKSSRPAFKRNGSGSEVDALLIGRAMHTKLSSPTRQKPSPAVTEARVERKHDKAQRNREILESNRRMRVEEAAQKAKLVKVRVESQQSAAEESHFAKLNEGSLRHAQHIDAIRSKAENENIKVSEVLFINGLTAAGIKKSLDDRLREVEARMEKGRIRKAEEMEAKKEQQRRKEIMVSLRLRNNEQLAGERWLKLQTLIEDVGRRRKNRLDEIARRRERQASAVSSISVSGSEMTSIAPFAVSSESLPTTPLPVPTSRPTVKKSHSLPHSPQDSKDEDEIAASLPASNLQVAEHNQLPHVRKCISLEEKKVANKSFVEGGNAKTNKQSTLQEQEVAEPPLKTNSRSQHLLSTSASPTKLRKSQSKAQSPVPLAQPGSLAAASFWEDNKGNNTTTADSDHPSVVGRELRRKDSEREREATRSAGLDHGASVFAPSAEPIVDPNDRDSPSSSSPPLSSLSPPVMSKSPTPAKNAFKRKGSGSLNESNRGSFNEGARSGGRGRKGKQNAQSFDENKPNKNEEDEGESGVANRGKKLRKLRTKLLRLAPGWNESRWGCEPSTGAAASDSWSTPVNDSEDASDTEPEVLNMSTRTRLDRCVEALRRFRDSSHNSSTGGKGAKNKMGSPPLKPCIPQASLSDLETSLHDLSRLLSDLAMGVGASSSAQSAAVQRRIRESGGLELLQQLTAPRHSAFNPTASPLALDALSLCFAGQSTQRDFVLAMDAGVGVVDAATHALEMVMTIEGGLNSPTSSGEAFGTTPGSSRSLASLSAMVERASQPSARQPKKTASDTSSPYTTSILYSQAGNPWESLNTTILLLMHLLRHTASPGLEVAQESMVRFLCVTGFLQDLVSLLTGNTGYSAIAAIALGNVTDSVKNKRYQLLTSVEARTLLRRSIALLEAIAAFPLTPSCEGGTTDPSATSSLRISMHSLSTANMDAGRAASGVRRLFEETNCGELMSLIAQVIEYGFKSSNPTTNSGGKVSDEALELCISGLSALNNLARLDLDLFQKLLLPQKVQSMCNQFLSTTRPSSTQSRMSRLSKALLSECVVLVGFYVLNVPSHQQLLLDSMNVYSRNMDNNNDDDIASTLLGKLIQLPRTTPAEKSVMLPTLLAATYKNESAQRVVGEDVMSELHLFVESHVEAMHSSQNAVKRTKSKEDLKRMSSLNLKIEVVCDDQPTGELLPHVALSHRFPVELWMGKDGFSVHSDRCRQAV